MILRNHGLLSVGKTVREAFEIMYYLDTACQIQIDAMAAGMSELQMIGDEVADKGYLQFQDEGDVEIGKGWKAMLRMLDRKGVTYRV
jgi:ribulose-5-phosphate 4-epimerase/fuculose-1-phosphate aldolase